MPVASDSEGEAVGMPSGGSGFGLSLKDGRKRRSVLCSYGWHEKGSAVGVQLVWVCKEEVGGEVLEQRLERCFRSGYKEHFSCIIF